MKYSTEIDILLQNVLQEKREATILWRMTVWGAIAIGLLLPVSILAGVVFGSPWGHLGWFEFPALIVFLVGWITLIETRDYPWSYDSTIRTRQAEYNAAFERELNTEYGTRK